MTVVNQIPSDFWDKGRDRWDSHRYFTTINHWHISDYSGEIHCDIMLVACQDGRFYLEDNWGDDAKGHAQVFNPFLKDSYPTFFNTFDAANEAGAKVVAQITGSHYTELMIDTDEED